MSNESNPPILLLGYVGINMDDHAGRLIRLHPTALEASRHAKPGSSIYLLTMTLDELIAFGCLEQVAEETA